MTSRVAFVSQPYRVHDDERPSVRAACPNARVIALDTNLSLAGAQVRATELLDGGGTVRAFEIVIEAMLFQDGMIDGPTRYAIYSEADGLSGEVFRAFDASLDLAKGITVVKVRQ